MALAQQLCVLFSAQLEQSAACGKLCQRSLASGCVLSSKSNANSNSNSYSFRSLQAIRLRPHQSWSTLLGIFAAVSAQPPHASSASFSSSSPPLSETTLNPIPQVAIAFKHVLLPIIDRNPYLSDSTRQTIATTTSLAKQNGADVTVVVIDHNVSEEARGSQEVKDKHALQLETIRWHLSEGGCGEYKLVERVGEGQKPAAVIGEMADDLGLDLVIMSMEAIHHKHIDGNLLGEFVPCPILMLPL